MALKDFLEEWIRRYPGPPTALHDFDADGLCAAALWKLRLGGTTQVVSARQWLPVLQNPARLVYLLDLSCPEERFPWQLPTVVIDHHPLPRQPPPDTLLLHRPDRCTAWLTHELLWGESDGPHAWIAALGILSDLGDSAAGEILQNQIRRWGLNPLRQLTSLVNSAHRAGADCEQALSALTHHDSPAQMLRSDHASMVYLRDCQRKVRKRLGQAKQVPAIKRGRIALVQFSSDCPIQSVVAQIWKARLADYVVLAANRRSDVAEVHISARSRGALNAIKILGQLGLIVRGHPQSAGAVLDPNQWEQFLEKFYAHSDQR
ncbi:MAG: hypothetical protein KF760_02865 [Candidatus Eremiobacteraeota bacterium]|nr:hypothetical protein [Candidatus Eremiobacteraeota bacterium]MCW5872358.1 hypothetical protein [Candidatus Eremiobacteraeota bacterium]